MTTSGTIQGFGTGLAPVPGQHLFPNPTIFKLAMVAGDDAVIGDIYAIAFSGGTAVGGASTIGTEPGQDTFYGGLMRDVTAKEVQGGWFGIALDTIVADSGDLGRFMFRGFYGGDPFLDDTSQDSPGVRYQVSNGTTSTMTRGHNLVAGSVTTAAGALHPDDDSSAVNPKIIARAQKGRAAAGGAVVVTGTIPVIFNGIEGFGVGIGS